MATLFLHRGFASVLGPGHPKSFEDAAFMPVKHVVLLRIKPSISPDRIRQLFAALGDLGNKIPGILDYSWGPNSSTEGLHKGFTHGFVMTFADEASRDAYLPHPDHEAVKDMVLPELDGGVDGVVVLDWVG